VKAEGREAVAGDARAVFLRFGAEGGCFAGGRRRGRFFGAEPENSEGKSWSVGGLEDLRKRRKDRRKE
jgi:hypothetical protein